MTKRSAADLIITRAYKSVRLVDDDDACTAFLVVAIGSSSVVIPLEGESEHETASLAPLLTKGGNALGIVEVRLTGERPPDARTSVELRPFHSRSAEELWARFRGTLIRDATHSN